MFKRILAVIIFAMSFLAVELGHVWIVGQPSTEPLTTVMAVITLFVVTGLSYYLYEYRARRLLRRRQRGSPMERDSGK